MHIRGSPSHEAHRILHPYRFRKRGPLTFAGNKPMLKSLFHIMKRVLLAVAGGLGGMVVGAL